MQDGFRYWAFISYSHYDRRWASWLHRKLERYRVPRRLVGGPHWSGARPRRLYPIFRDRDELPSSADLGGVVHQALRESRYLIVLCSRHAAASRWVNEEVETFKKLGREDRILCLKIDEVDDDRSCFAPALLQAYDADGYPCEGGSEPLAADAAAHADGRQGAVLKLIAGMLGVGYDDLRRRERRRRIQQHLALGVAASALILMAVSGWHWQQVEKREALASQEREARLNKLYESGRAELLAHNEARAAVYLNEAYREGVDTPALRYLLGRAMRAVDAQRLRFNTGTVLNSVGINSDATLAYAITQDKQLRVYDLQRGGVPLYDKPLGGPRRWLMGYSPGGTLLWLVAAEQGQATNWQLWLFDAHSGTQRARFEMRASPASVFVPPVGSDDRHFAFVAPDGAATIARLDAQAGATIRHRIAGDYSVAHLCSGGQYFLAARRDGQIELRDLQSGALRRRYTETGGTPTILSSAAGCRAIAAGTAEGAVRVWETMRGSVLVGSGHLRSVVDLQFDREGSRLLSMSRGSAAIWDGRSGALLYASKYFGGTGNIVMLRADGRQFAQLIEGRLTVFDATSAQEAYTLDGHMGVPTRFAFAQSVPQVISSGADGSIVVWSLPEEERTRLGSALPDMPPAAAVSADGQWLFVSEAAGGGALWQRQPLRKQREVSTAQAFISVASFTPDGRWLATGSVDGSVVLSEVESGKVVRRIDKLGGRPPALYFDAQSRFLAAELIDGGLRVWDLQDGSERLSVAAGAAAAVAMAPQGALLAYGARGQMRLLDLEQGGERWNVALPQQEIELTSAAFSRDGRQLVVTAAEGRVYVIDVEQGRIVSQLHDRSAQYFATAAFDADGRQIVIGDLSNSARIWRPDDGRLLTLRGHTNPVQTAVFSPDGYFAMTAGLDGFIRIWDADKGELLESFMAHDGVIQWRGASFVPDGTQILSAGRDGYVQLRPFRLESRDADDIAAILECRVAWRVLGTALVPHEVDPARCAQP